MYYKRLNFIVNFSYEKHVNCIDFPDADEGIYIEKAKGLYTIVGSKNIYRSASMKFTVPPRHATPRHAMLQ